KPPSAQPSRRARARWSFGFVSIVVLLVRSGDSRSVPSAWRSATLIPPRGSCNPRGCGRHTGHIVGPMSSGASGAHPKCSWATQACRQRRKTFGGHRRHGATLRPAVGAWSSDRGAAHTVSWIGPASSVRFHGALVGKGVPTPARVGRQVEPRI